MLSGVSPCGKDSNDCDTAKVHEEDIGDFLRDDTSNVASAKRDNSSHPSQEVFFQESLVKCVHGRLGTDVNSVCEEEVAITPGPRHPKTHIRDYLS